MLFSILFQTFSPGLYRPMIQLKSNSSRDKIFRDKITATIKFMMDSYSGRILQWFQEQTCLKNLWKISCLARAFNFSKKDPTTRLAVSRTLTKSECSKCAVLKTLISHGKPLKGFCLFIASLQGFFSKAGIEFICIVMISTNEHRLKTSSRIAVWGKSIFKKTLLGQKGKEHFRKMKKVHK